MVVYTLFPEENKPKSPLKWAGGKQQLIPQLRPFFPPKFSGYSEPFVGGGAVFFDLRPDQAVLIDSSFELMNFYQVVQSDLPALLLDLKRHENTPEYFYDLRAQDPELMSRVARASRFLFLNKTGYNGLWRVNRRGQCNVPYGWYKKPHYLDEDNLRGVNLALQNTRLICADFSEILDHATPRMFIYFDPPYYPLNQTAKFTSYTRESFGEDDQRRLAEVFKALDDLGCYVMLSNSETDFVREIYQGWDIQTVYARRVINCRGDRRGPVTELVIRNYR